jgi:hypothetical protein
MPIQAQKPPPGFCFAQDSTDEDGNVVVPGIATRLGISYSLYRKWRMAGIGPETTRLGKRVIARIEAVDAFLNNLAPAVNAPANESRPAEPRRRRAA